MFRQGNIIQIISNFKTVVKIFNVDGGEIIHSTQPQIDISCLPSNEYLIQIIDAYGNLKVEKLFI
jgi:hypothetical protein